MKIAVPCVDGKLCMHFGHCDRFALVEVDPDAKTIREEADATPPPHAPGVLPEWLAEQGVTVVIAGGMGRRAQSLFERHGIKVVVGAAADTPRRLAEAWLAGNLQTGDNICDH